MGEMCESKSQRSRELLQIRQRERERKRDLETDRELIGKKRERQRERERKRERDKEPGLYLDSLNKKIGAEKMQTFLNAMAPDPRSFGSTHQTDSRIWILLPRRTVERGVGGYSNVGPLSESKSIFRFSLMSLFILSSFLLFVRGHATTRCVVCHSLTH